MTGQLTIWDYLEPDTGNPLDKIPEEEMVHRIGIALGLTFKWNSHLEHWEAKCGHGVTADVEYSTWDTGDERQGQRFIGCGVSYSRGGCSCGQETIEKAVNYLFKSIQVVKEEVRKDAESRRYDTMPG